MSYHARFLPDALIFPRFITFNDYMIGTLTPPHVGLMKAEPESRLEKGKDVKFSIDDLKAATEPEGWDGKIAPQSLALTHY